MCCFNDIKVFVTTLVRTTTYRCAVTMLQNYKLIVKELLEQGVVRPNKSQDANPGFFFKGAEQKFVWYSTTGR